MGVTVFLGVFLASILCFGIGFSYIRRKIRDFSQKTFQDPDILNALSGFDMADPTTPRSLSGCDSLMLPQILRDFPDYDAALAKTYVRDYLKEEFCDRDELTIHNVVISRYLPSAAQKTIVFQAAVSWTEDQRIQQKRFDICYAYLLGQEYSTIAANCPNCGGAIGYGISVCPYCDSRVANVLGNTWYFTEITET